MHFESAFLAALNIFVVSIAFKMRQILCHYYCIFFLLLLYVLSMRRKSDQNAGGAKKDKPVEDLGHLY